MRQSLDENWMEVARVVAKRSTCIRRKHGAVIVKNKELVSTGYNGAPRGWEHCTSKGCNREELEIPSGHRYELCRGVHAEMNAVIQGEKQLMEDATIYITGYPCRICEKLIVNAEIGEIKYLDDGEIKSVDVGKLEVEENQYGEVEI
ncbi:dCMP deaminase family protein [Methanonatronarchaeum sp. AMET6-2]|uniref:deoxycytidylate deaminase n=1 Tax=Methanonatronarchaeum sp. AMET6-2 TaxID=2933293 RepID=UPI001FF59DCC|nr:dCMP deaminase family protein [Methanonatronarchaeum sp. AMET6-2]UOY10748.1 dCMP deaminase family protein [Methanonatronarchaeum sp. AMET6-2]